MREGRTLHRQKRRAEISYEQQGEEQQKQLQPEMWQGNAPGQPQCNENNPPRKECVRGRRQQDDESRRCQANKIGLTPVGVGGGKSSPLGIKVNGNAS